MTDLYVWDPNEWELFVYSLLQDRHGPVSVMKVPARHKGDFGLDYYCLSARVVYQCYAVQEPCDVAERANKQKAKITEDLKNKFCTRTHQLSELFGSTKIDRWVLSVPLHDSSTVNAHLTAKTAEVRALGLPYVSENFEALIQDQDAFEVESRGFRLSQLRSISLQPQPPTADEIEDELASNPLAHALRTKLRKRVGGDDANNLAQLVREAIGWFLERDNTLESLRLSAPQLYEAVASVISRQTRRLQLLGPPAEGAAHDILGSKLQEFIAALKDSVPNFTSDTAEQMALGTIADWLLRCPLDFPPYDHAP